MSKKEATGICEKCGVLHTPECPVDLGDTPDPYLEGQGILEELCAECWTFKFCNTNGYFDN